MSTERNLPPTPRRLTDARAAGLRPRSHDLVALGGLCAACMVAVSQARDWLTRWRQWLSASIEAAAQPTPDVTAHATATRDALLALAWPLMSVAIALVAATLLGWLVQGAWRWRGSRGMAPMLHPVQGLRTLWWWTKACVISAAFASVAHHASRALVTSVTADVGFALRLMTAMARLMQSRVGIVLALLVVADVIVEHALWRRSLRMTRQELKRELRETEGDPTLRGERRARQRATVLES